MNAPRAFVDAVRGGVNRKGSALVRRFVFGFGANAFGQLVSIAIQVFSLPLFLTYWSASTYGGWVLLSAIPGYLTMADVGMISVAGNRMMMSMARNDVDEARRIFHTAHLFLTVMCLGLFALTTPLVLLLPLPDYVTLDGRIALAALMAAVLVAIYGGLAEAVFKATDRYPQGTMLGHVARLAEWAGYMVGLLAFGSFAGVALTGLLGRTIATGTMIALAQSQSRGLDLGYRHASARDLAGMVGPAVSFMAFPLANALSFQGVTLVVGALAGPSAVALFTVYRTVARVAVQVTSIFSLALWPEFSRAYGRDGARGVSPIYKLAAVLGIGSALVLSLALYLIGPWLLSVWTHGRIPFEPVLMAWMLAYAAVGGAWHVPRTLLQSTNRHVSLSAWCLAVGALCVALAGLLGAWAGLVGVTFGMLLSELLIASICFRVAHQALRTTE